MSNKLTLAISLLIIVPLVIAALLYIWMSLPSGSMVIS